MDFIYIEGAPSTTSFGSLFLSSPIVLTTYELNIEVGIPTGTPIGTFSSSIPGTFYYSLVSGEGSDDNNYFIILENEILSNNLLDKNDFFIRVRAASEDGICYEQRFVIKAVDTLVQSGFFDSYLGNLVYSSGFALQGINSLQGFGNIESSFIFALQGFNYLQDLGSLTSSASLSLQGTNTSQEFGNPKSSAEYFLQGVNSSQSFGYLFLSSPILLSTYDLSALESFSVGTAIGVFSLSISGIFTYSLVAGDGAEDNSYFVIIDNELVLNSEVDKRELGIRVRASGQDGYCYEQKFIVSLAGIVLLDGFSDGQTGTPSVKVLFNSISLINSQYLSNHTTELLIGSGGIASQESVGGLIFDGLVMLEGFYGEALGLSTISSFYSLGSIQTQESLDNSILVDYFSFEQVISWDIDKFISVSSSFYWDVGQGQQRWYRVQGCCLFPTSQGSGVGIPGKYYPGGCDVSNFQSTDSKCVGAGGKQLFIQNILATGVSDVCRQLNEYNMKWQVCSIKVYSNPAGPAQDSCNALVDVPFSSYPECLEISLVTDALIKVVFSDKVYFSFKHVGSGGVEISGQAVPVGGESLSDLFYEGSGGLSVSGSATVENSWQDLLEVQADFGFLVDYIESIGSFAEPPSRLVGASASVKTVCGNCTSIPSVLYSYNNIDKSYIISRFVKRNSIVYPDYFPMYYNSLLKSWTSNYQFSGQGDSGKESWNFVFSWSCLNQRAEEYSSPYWKYSIYINRVLPSIDFDTRVNIVFPPEELCRLIDNLSVDFSFSLNTTTQYVDNSFVDVTDYVVVADGIGLFKDSSWLSDPWLSTRLSRSISSSQAQTIDLSPIIP